MKILPTEFEGQSIRRVYDEASDTWWFSVMDVVQVLTQQPDDLTARKYWNQLKRRLAKEGSQLVTACHQLKMPAADGKQRLTDAATAQTLLRLVQSVPSPKAEPIKLWLAKVGYERMQELADPALSLDRARQTWQQHGRLQCSQDSPEVVGFTVSPGVLAVRSSRGRAGGLAPLYRPVPWSSIATPAPLPRSAPW